MGTGPLKRDCVSFAGQPEELLVPADNIAAEITFTDFPAIGDLRERLFHALEHPFGCDPLSTVLRPGMKVAIPVGSRVTDWMLGVRHQLGLPLLDYLNGLGIRDEDVTILYAAGLHATHAVAGGFGAKLDARGPVVFHH